MLRSTQGLGGEVILSIFVGLLAMSLCLFAVVIFLLFLYAAISALIGD